MSSTYSNEELAVLKEIEELLTSELKGMEAEAIFKYSIEKGREVSIHALHGLVGGKNNTYVDSVRMQFSDPNDFKARWIKGFIEYIGTSKYSPLRNLLKDKVFRKYTLTFLERNFYRNLRERTRAKPNENLWAIWFGSGTLVWGLLIAPVYRSVGWTNDVSEIRRASYMYWTVGHVMNTGLVDPENNELIKFKAIDELISFYRNILKRVSNSLYEKQIFDFYTDYLKRSSDPFSEPFLIPEFRYEGLEVNHRYRLDFTILNAHTMELIGFEFSPHSTHMSVAGIKTKKQKEVNEELSTKWDKEMGKRNKYLSQFDITTITFSDSYLADIASCFKVMEDYLAKRPAEKISLEEQIVELEKI